MKKNRQEKIIELINTRVIDTQEDLQKALNDLGFSVTQATVSRDIKELRIVKALDLNGVYRYTINQAAFKKNAIKYNEIFSNSVVQVQSAMNDVVIKCHPGMAQGACAALDSMFGNLMLGTLAGDDTILAITHSAEEAQVLVRKIQELI